MKHNIAAWVLALTLVAAIAVFSVSSHGGQETHYLDASRPRLLLSHPFDPVERDDPLVDRYNATVPAMPEVGAGASADRPAC